MNNFNFGDVLTKAWQITWKNKVLWIFGILAGCGSNSGSFNNNFSNTSSYQQDSSTLPPDILRGLGPVEEFFNSANVAAIVAVILCLICVVMLAAIFLSTVGRIGLIKGAAQAEAGRTLAFGELWSESQPYFWRVFLLNFLAGLPILILVAMIIVGAFVAIGGMVGVAETTNEEAIYAALIPLLGGSFLLLCCLSLFSMVIQFIVNQGYNAIILEEQGVVEGFKRGWDVIVKNIGPMILMAIMLYIIRLVIGFVIAIPAFIILLPIIMGGVAAGVGAGGLATVPIVLGVLCLCLYAPIAWVVSGVLETYSQSAWTLTFLRVTLQPQPPAPLQTLDAPATS